MKQKANNNTLLYRFESEYTPGTRLRLKVEINCREHFTVFGIKEFPFELNSEWFSGQAGITTYELHELLGTKLRALYQRKKGRDLFDLHFANQHLELDNDKIVEAFRKYIQFTGGKPPTQKQFMLNIEAKERDITFLGDMEGLIRPGVQYDQASVFEWVKENIIKKLK